MNTIEFTDSIVEYLLGILIVFLFTKKLFNLKSAKLYFAVSGTVLFLMIASFLFLEGELQNGIVVNLEFWGLMLTPFLLKGPKKFYIFSTAITLSSVIMFVAFYLVLVLSFFGQNITHSIFLEFTGMITSLIVSIIFFVLCTVLKNQTKFFIENISKPIVLLLNLFLIIGGNFSYIVSLLDSGLRYAFAVKLLTMLISLIFTIAFPVLIYNQVKKNLYRYETGIFEQQLNIQREYGKTIAQASAQLRRFRHDYNNLSLWIKPLLEQGKSQQALELVKKSDREIISSYSILYNTGSDTADAILSERLKQLTKEVKISFSGNLTKLPEDNFDICVLLNNTIDIALFSLQSITSDGEKLIEISAMCKQGVLLYKISFPCENNGFFDDLQSSKDDMLKMNILRKLTEKNDGKMDTHIENQVASITVRYIF
ncbi:GHKL domain-containing protein [uncultured Ruminococcus sp.]|uniref:GHKL domain-containing protein n=1 Tax=uncultured Ruminococcus sp. TaxID=165186 RepID=UPI0025CC6A28|nr:GHKL domain-containing protein [uncultured Ruminococcus sp.]